MRRHQLDCVLGFVGRECDCATCLTKILEIFEELGRNAAFGSGILFPLISKLKERVDSGGSRYLEVTTDCEQGRVSFSGCNYILRFGHRFKQSRAAFQLREYRRNGSSRVARQGLQRTAKLIGINRELA